MSPVALHQWLDESARRSPQQTAIVEPGAGSITYRELANQSDRVRDQLIQIGVRPGDRVGICLRKSIEAVTAILGVLKTGAAYVPVDPAAPAARNEMIFKDCSVKTVISGPLTGSAPAAATRPVSPEDIAYILYTSGSTGVPKGVTLSHRNAVSFVEWCSQTFAPMAEDRFSSHAPFHFDLSILDIYLPLKHGATLVLISDEVGKSPGLLAPLIAEQRITVWYSTPSILSMLTQYGKMAQYDYSALRLVLFAGEVFPVKHLRALTAILPRARYFNLYGPTETNVCTYFEVPVPVPAERTEPFPIGKTCSHVETMVSPEDELCVRGDGVMQGYWNRPEQTAQAFLPGRWYRTGDFVVEGEDGNYVYRGRRDRMVKKRGYRVELGEIEAGLYRHPAIKEAAVIALADEENGVRIKAYLSCRDEKRPSLIELKAFCAQALPAYMVPDLFSVLDALPKTSTDKIDYQKLKTTN